MDPIDREVLALRHFEQLTVSEAAAVLGIKEKAAGMRYVRPAATQGNPHQSRRMCGAMTMSDSTSGPDLFNMLADEFADRYRRGERPPLSEYTDKYPELADQIRELFPALVAIEQFGTGAEQATGLFAVRPAATEPIPERLGDYRILREIGRGGMGIVYEAVQESLGRHVALKVLPQHRIRDSNSARAVSAQGPRRRHAPPHQHRAGLRRRRAQRGAPLRHAVHRGPEPGRRPPRGQAAARCQTREPAPSSAPGDDPAWRPAWRSSWCPGSSRAQAGPCGDGVRDGIASPPPGKDSATASEHRALSFPPPPRRSWADGGYLLSQRGPDRCAGGRGVAYAHHHKLLHRDIKPSNLLLDMRGTVWVTDFGLAKAEGTEALTQIGDIVGTLRYMAPEQFQRPG